MSTSTRRRSPVAAPSPEPAADPSTEVHPPTEVQPPTEDHPEDTPVIAHPPEELTAARVDRDARFAEGLRRLRIGGTGLRLDERALMVAGGVVGPLGVIVVLLGWWGAAHTPYVFEQVPYLISGGLLGLGMVFLGAFCYFTHWVTRLVKEQREQSSAVLAALQALTEEVAATGRAPTRVTAAVTTNGAQPGPGPSLVATERGTMAHRPDCVVVAGKGGLRTVTAADGLTACKFCEPYAATVDAG